jgi:quercetin dioxygenase-like cupin family protein
MMRFAWLAPIVLLLPAYALAIDNAYVRVTRDAAPCAQAGTSGCAERVIVALGELSIESGGGRRTLARGDVAVFPPEESYLPPRGASYFEVAIKPDHPASDSPGETIPPEKNALRYDGERFFVFEEKLDPGDTRARHSHSQRVVIQLNRARLQQWPEGRPDILVETVPEQPSFSPPVIHVVKNVGEVLLRGIVIEFRPGVAGTAAR